MNKLNPIIPMAAVSAHLSEEEVAVMMKSYADTGIEQYLFYERGGTADNIEYMSEEWLQLCGCIFKYAKKYGIKIWLYDEYDCPSGHCHGAVMKDHLEYRSQFIRITGGKYEIGYFDKYADILNPEVTDRFITLTHEIYYSRFREYFGDTIIGIFSDEPSFVYSSFHSNDDPEGSKKYAYTKGLADDYSRITGRDFFIDAVNGNPEFFKAYFEIMGKKLCDNYISRVRKWCDTHSILFTGHLIYEEELVMSLRSSYDSIAALRCFSLPGIDELTSSTTPETAEWITFGCLQAAARLSGKGAFCEVSGLGPTDQPLERKLQMLYLEAFFGINHYLLAMAHADARENIYKKNWFTPMNYIQPWFKGMPLFIKEAEKAAELAEKTIIPEIYVRYPIETVAEKFGHANINAEFLSLLRGLTENQYQWQLIDREEEPPRDAKFVADYNTPLNDIITAVKLNTTVTDNNGNLAENVFVRRYTDGTVCILDLTDDSNKSRKLILRENGREIRFTLYSRGIYINNQVPTEYKLINKLMPKMSLSLDRPNILRCAFPGDDTEFRFTVTEKLDGISLYIRKYVFDGTVSLDGKIIIADKVCSDMQYGIGKLYCESEKFSLDIGQHIITISEHAESEPYLPAVLIAGCFAANKQSDLFGMPKEVGCELLSDGILPNFAGVITYEFKIKIPQINQDVMLGFDSQELYSRVFVNDIPVGEKFANPFVFCVDKFKGETVSVKIEQYTSIAPMFGYPEDVVPDVSPERVLRYYFPGKYERCGITDMRFVTV